ncbi:MAG: hypothetical protein K5651_01475 [Bacteroidales bacterium]|nr:hypothetical protein [Bacteroidales bacterium]
MKMKSLMKSLMALAIGLTLFSCAKENGKGVTEPSVSLTVSPTELVFNAAGGEDKAVTVTCDTYWKAYLDEDWLAIDMEEGYLNQTITVSVADENDSTEPLTATLTIVAGKIEQVVTITQAAGAPYLTITDTPGAFDGEAGQDFFEVGSNLEWTATSNADWLTILGFEDDVDDETVGAASFDGEGSGKVVIAVAANDTYAERTAKITLTSGELSDEFTVTQQAKVNRVAVSPEEAAAPAAGSEIEVAVTSNTDWTVEIPAEADWCTVDEAAGSGDGTLTFTIAANETGVLRSVAVKVKVSDELSKTITISQGRIMPAAVKKDSLALIAIYNAADGATWTEQHRWDFSKPIYEWQNVKTDPATGRVTSLSLTANNLVKVEWELPSSIGDLTALTVLKINNQKLQGAIPSVVYTLTSLEQLYFTGNNLTGEISSNIGNLTKLKNLYVDKNANLGGTIPATIGQLTELNYINVSQTGVGGAVPSELTNCSKLNGFMAFKSALTSIDIAWDTFTHLQMIQAYGCPGLTGTLPACLGSVVTDKNIFTIQLYDCNFTGNVPDDWANLTTKCTQVYINGNKLSGTLPVGFYQHANYAAKWNAAQRILPQQEGFGLTEPVPNND